MATVSTSHMKSSWNSHVYHDMRREYSGFGSGYFDGEGKANYYVTDWQGNVAMVIDSEGETVQTEEYYPYGEPVREPEGQRYLFGGKEREHTDGRNNYDFGARSLTPYGRWSTPDPLSESDHGVSPFVYCAGDPINNIDPDGRWKVNLSRDDRLYHNLRGVGFDTRYHVIGHGHVKEGIHYAKKDKSEDDKNHITTGEQLIEAITENMYAPRDLRNEEALDIVLHSCDVGRNGENGEKPIAQKISEGIPNAVITAPNGTLAVTEDGVHNVYKVYDEAKGVKIKQTENPWRLFFRGKEYPIESKDQILLYLQNGDVPINWLDMIPFLKYCITYPEK